MRRPRGVRELGHRGYVSELGEWGPIINGGAWLTVEASRSTCSSATSTCVERWLDDAEQGRFEVLTQNGYVVGAPTYVPVGELAINRPLSGELPQPEYPERARGGRRRRWRRARRGVADVRPCPRRRRPTRSAAPGMLAGAVLSAAHARLAERREWVLNEKLLVGRAGLEGIQELLARPGATSAELGATVAAVAGALGVEPLSAR